jgi:hypothetical protein
LSKIDCSRVLRESSMQRPDSTELSGEYQPMRRLAATAGRTARAPCATDTRPR